MKGVSVFILLGIWLSSVHPQFLNHRPFPKYSLENMPDTEFSCRDKILGGYYADVETMCQMFHICVKVAGVGVQDFRFLCPNGTAFDQDHQICADWEDVDCDSSTLYYSSDNFDLYRIGSGFESKAVKYGEDEETFALQRAETGDARLNREHQAQRVNQQKEPTPFRRNRPQNNNNEKDIFKGSSSSNFFNNQNGGKENDEDYEDNVNINQNNDNVQKRKLVRKQQRRPVQNDNNQSNNNNDGRRPDNLNTNNRRPATNNQQQSNNRNNDNQQRQPQNNRGQLNNRQQQNNRPAQNTNYEQKSNNDRQEGEYEVQTYRPARPTGFINNFAGSSYVPTTSRPSSTSTVADNINSPSPTYTISTPAPFRQTQQYNNPPNRQTTQNTYNNGQYNPTTHAPQKETENYPANFPKQSYKPTENYSKKQTENYSTQPAVTRNNQYNTQYDVPKVKPTENYPTQPPTRNNQYNNEYTQAPKTTQYDSQFDIKKVRPTKQNQNNPTTGFNNNDNYSTQFNKKTTTPFKQNDNYPTTFAPKFNKSPSPQYNNDNFPSTFSPRTNTGYTQITQQTTQYNSQPNQRSQYNSQPNQKGQFNSQNDQYNPQPQQKNQYNSQPNQNGQSDQGSQYNSQPKQNNQYNSQLNQTNHHNSQRNHNSQYTSQSNQNNNQQSTPRTTAFTQYTPTVPKISSTTPVPRSNRFDETQYDDGSYNPNQQDDEFLKTAHSQNIASSRNEYAKSTKNAPPSTQKPYFESPRPFSVSSNTPKVTEHPKSTPRPLENKNAGTTSTKKVKDVSYDYAYYDTNVGSEPEYEIDTEIKKSSVKN